MTETEAKLQAAEVAFEDLKAKYDMLNEHCEILEAENKQLRRTIVYMAVKHMKDEAGE